MFFVECICELLLVFSDELMVVDIELLLMFVVWVQYFVGVICLVLVCGVVVFCDCFIDVIYVYQGGGCGLLEVCIVVLESFVQGDLWFDFMLVFDLLVEIGLVWVVVCGWFDCFEQED